ncbi:MAG: succinate dehydrogenase, hydrophobic membrane anchor protein [Gammaproteobacteria bacterium]
MSLKTPLGQVLGLGSAKDGTGHWWVQRLSAVALIPLGLWFAISLVALPDLNYDTVRLWIAEPTSNVGLVLFVVAAGYHSLLGLQVVVEDYVGGALKMVTLITLSLVHIGLGVAGVLAVLRIGFGGGV